VPKIRFDGHEVEAVEGRDILSQLLAHDIPINHVCMSGNCRTCCVTVISGNEHLEPLDEVELYHFPDGEGGKRLACQAISRATGDVVITQK
jgi:ferredoxin